MRARKKTAVMTWVKSAVEFARDVTAAVLLGIDALRDEWRDGR